MSLRKGLIALCLSSCAALAQAASYEPPPLKLEPLARFSVDLVAPIWELGATSGQGKRRIIPITGGHFEGPRLKGTILNNGADWQVVTPEGVAIIDTRYLLQTDDGALIYLRTEGYRFGPPEVMKKVAAGEDVDPSLYQFRITMHFETSAPQYAWLNRTVGVGSAMRLGNAVVYDAFEVK
ncbi:DUF3237 domain-containing protein [Pseudomonas kermanshahensis]|jgi:hypothetical protein|uniref:UPF0311 protein V7V80_06770 n=2 Tax=Pseudomonas TaxID=286 RepID=A0ABU8R3C9_9PSED|nr:MULTISPECIES: DUF3237 domain-containing protein [unclassified Pseudomonas]GLO58417.1 UPF0311 protein [Pseudomonas putida]MBC3488395.1 DUF3237 domain-containing protein [Pseudomonas sp. SWRI50]MCX2685450.1 DUF3237 domain-containing protein [Pseudomonas sp. DCB_AW]SMF48443.1 Protein of unknown function [Pseudomonas sp. LAIL14HWK12:I11]SMR73904.1 Protein of unknown function [Pseudomonas sp. LAIL14HWK12:I10]